MHSGEYVDGGWISVVSRLLVAVNLAVLALMCLAAVSDWHTSGNVVHDNTFWDDTTVANERAQAGAGTPTYTQIVDGAYEMTGLTPSRKPGSIIAPRR